MGRLIQRRFSSRRSPKTKTGLSFATDPLLFLAPKCKEGLKCLKTGMCYYRCPVIKAQRTPDNTYYSCTSPDTSFAYYNCNDAAEMQHQKEEHKGLKPETKCCVQGCAGTCQCEGIW